MVIFYRDALGLKINWGGEGSYALGIFDIIVAEEYRGKGFGRDIMDGILSAALEKRVKKGFLSVVAGNVSTENLYQKLGFKEIYRYWYRRKNG